MRNRDLCTNEWYFTDKKAGLLLEMKYWLAYRIFRPVRAAFGGRVRHMAVGAAPIDRHILEVTYALVTHFMCLWFQCSFSGDVESQCLKFMV